MTPKLQQGASFDALFTTYKPIPIEAPRRREESSGRSSRRREKEEDSEKGKLTEKDLFSMLKDLDGLPNEMQALVGSLSRTLKLASITGDGDLNNLASTYLNSLYKLKSAKYNRDLFKETYDRAVSNDSLNDIAITLDGKVLALDQEDNIVPFTTEQWVQVKDSGEYKPLTNSNLLWMRSHLPNYAGKNQLFQIVENGVGIEQVHKMIKERFQKLGEQEQSTETFLPKEVAMGMQIVNQMLQLGPEGYYKITQDLSQTDQRQVDAALTYIYNTLPANARTRLAVETPDGTQASAKSLIGSMIFETLNSKSKTSAQYLGTAEKLTGKTADGKPIDQDDNVVSKWLKGYGAKENFLINVGDSTFYSVHANTMPLVKMNNDYLGVGSTLQQVSQGLYEPVLDLRNASMGMKTIDPAAFGQIVLTDGNISSIDFPCIERDGIVVPNLSPDVKAKKQKSDAEIKQRGIDLSNPDSIRQNYGIINKIYEENGLPPAYNEQGELIPQNWRRFGVINGKASNKALGMGQFDSNRFLQEDTDDNSVQNYINITKDENWDTNNWFWNGVDHLYKGTIWIPVKVNYQAALANMKMKSSETLALEQQQQALDMQQSLQLGRQLAN